MSEEVRDLIEIDGPGFRISAVAVNPDPKNPNIDQDFETVKFTLSSKFRGILPLKKPVDVIYKGKKYLVNRRTDYIFITKEDDIK